MTRVRDSLRDRVFWAMTLLMSALGTCDRLKISSSAEKDKRIVGFGYNGALPGQPHCDDEGHLMINGHCERTRHAEMNLKDNTDQEKLRGAHVRVAGTPCLKCLKDLVGGGVQRIDYTGFYNNQEFNPTRENLRALFGGEFFLNHCEYEWNEVFQELFDLMAQPGGILYRSGYRLKVTKEPMEK